MKYCYHCMQVIDDSNAICPGCGHDPNPQVPPHHLTPGTILNDKYLVGQALGEGGFGITYIGFDLNLEMVIAIKEYYPNGYVNRTNTATQFVSGPTDGERRDVFDQGRDRFLKEARVLAKYAGESGIVNIRDFFQENNTAYIIMEYLRGVTLKEYLKQRGKIPADEMINLLMPMMQSLKKVHQQGMIHRDIAPDNIMLTEDKVKLLDFGAARDVSNGNKSLSVMLKPGFAPEEQYRSRGVQGPWTDIYAISATIYKCITGVTPDDSTQRMYRDELKRPSELGIAINPNVENALMKGLCVNQEGRYQNVDELMRGLQGNDSFTSNPAGTPMGMTGSPAGAPIGMTGSPANTPMGMTGAGNVVNPGPTGNSPADKPKKSKKKKVLIIVAIIVLLGIIGVVASVMDDSGKKSSKYASNSSSNEDKTPTKVVEKEITPEAEKDTPSPVPTEASYSSDVPDTIETPTEAVLPISTSTPTPVPVREYVTLNVYSFNSEMEDICNRYMQLHPYRQFDINVTTFTNSEEYTAALDQMLVSSSSAPDIYAMDSNYVLKYTQGDYASYAASYRDLGIDVNKKINSAQIAPYVCNVGTRPYDNEVVALSYQSTGGCFIYRRSIAQDIWGTDDPAKVQKKIGGGTGKWDKFWSAAEDCKSNGYYVVSGIDDIWNVVAGGAEKSWIVNGNLNIDPKRESFIDMAKRLLENGYTLDHTSWGTDWYADMKQSGKVLGYFGPAWLLNYIIAINNDSYGDWAVCQSPVAFSWGGSYLAASKYIPENKKLAAAELLEWILLDTSEEGMQYRLANGILFDNGGTKDTCSSMVVLRKSDGAVGFTGYQDVFEYFIPASENVTGKNLSQYDYIFEGYFKKYVRQYCWGEIYRADVLTNFRDDIYYYFGIY